MGNDFGWIIPVIAVLVWIIGSVWRNAEAAKKANQASGRPPQRPPRPKVSEIDRFLEEINRRRQGAGGTEAPRVEAPPPPRPAVVQAERPSPPVRPKPVAQRPRPAAKKPQPSPSAARAAIEVVEVVETTAARPAARGEAGSVAAVVKVPPVLPSIAPRSKAALEVQALLNKPDGLAAAFILGEILGPPVSRRRRG